MQTPLIVLTALGKASGKCAACFHSNGEATQHVLEEVLYVQIQENLGEGASTTLQYEEGCSGLHQLQL